MSVAATKSTTLSDDGGVWGPGFQEEPFPLKWKACSERPGGVKGAPSFGAAKRTLDGEDRSEIID